MTSRRWSILLPVALLVAVGAVIVGGSGNPVAPDMPSPVSLADPYSTYDPVRAGEPLPEGYRPLLERDAINPLYAPTVLPAGEVDWDPDTLVIGVALGGEARAYPINHLNVREMVNDRIGGIPVLVTW